MPKVTVARVARANKRDEATTSTVFTFGGTDTPAWIKHSSTIPELKTNRGDIFVLPALFLAMRRGEDLELSDAVSAELIDNIDTVQDIYVTWFPEVFTKVTVSAPASQRNRALRSARGGSGMAFTGGIDSMFSLITSRTTPTALVNSTGLDLDLARDAVARETRARLGRIAAVTGTSVVPLSTNLRKIVLANDIRWGEHSFAAVIASFGHLLAGTMDTFVIPASHSYLTAIPWGSNPLVDPLYGSDRLRVVHHGAAFNRARKTEAIAHHELTRTEMRVCLKITTDENCGECRKCLRTMLALDVMGALSNSERFPQTLDFALLKKLPAHHPQEITMMHDVRELAVEHGAAQRYLDAIDDLCIQWRNELDGVSLESAPDQDPGGTA